MNRRIPFRLPRPRPPQLPRLHQLPLRCRCPPRPTSLNLRRPPATTNMKRFLALASFAVVLPLLAQEKKNAPPAKPDRAAQARAAVNEAKRDERNKERIKDLESAVKKALKNNDAAAAEIDRL